MSATGIYGDASSHAHVQGVAVGLVINNVDPQTQGRVQVKFPNLADADEGPWARIAAPYAGNQRGFFFLPEVGDEVLVAFEAGDITRPYVIGALWNGQDAPPTGDQDHRLIQSRSGHIIRLDDTDGAEKIEIIDKTGNNSITFDAANNTIKITSSKDIEFDASSGTFKVTAQKVSISTSGDTEVDAQGQLTLNATSTTTIKGATVNIN